MAPLSESLDQNKSQHLKSEGPPTKQEENEMQKVLEFARHGYAEYAAGNHARALSLVTEALVIAERLSPESAEVAVLLTTVGNMRRESGVDSGLKYHWKALQIRMRDQPGTESEAESHEKVGLILLAEHQYTIALQHLHEALSFHKSMCPSSLITARQYMNVGQTHHKMGTMDQALISFDKAMDILNAVKPESEEVARLHVLIGSVLREQRQLKKSSENLEKAINLYQEISPASGGLASAYVELGKINGAQGCYRKEMYLYHKALDIQNEVSPDSLDMSSILHHLGVFYATAGKLDAGEKYLRHAVAILEAHDPLTVELTKSQYALGQVLLRRGETTNAIRYHRRALELRSRTAPLSIDEADSLHAMGGLMLKTGNWQESLRYFSREFLCRDIDAVETARVHNIIGKILMNETVRLGDAISNHRMAVAIQARHGVSETLARYLEDLVAALRRKGECTSKFDAQLEEVRKILDSKN
jgi:tetratricopeptide (TPR) repeat protein